MQLRLIGAIVLGTIALVVSAVSAASERVTGTVLAVDRTAHTATVAHQAFGDMPAMTMTFALSDADATRVVAGERITATVDRRHEPWRLDAVTISGSAPPSTMTVAPIRIGDVLAPAGLIDASGRPFTFEALRGKTVALAFIFTRCRDAGMCPLVTGKFAQLQRIIDPRRMALVELTLDPGFDTPPVLARYAAQFAVDPARFTVAGGDAATLQRLAAGFDLAPRRDAQTLIHAERLIVLDPAGHVADLIDGNAWTVPGALAELQSVAGIAYNPLLRVLVHATWGVESFCGIAPSGTPLALHHAGFGVVGVPLLAILIVAFVRETRRAKRVA